MVVSFTKITFDFNAYSDILLYMINYICFVLFLLQHIVFAVSSFIAWVIPDIPKRLNEQIKRENYLAKLAIRGDNLLNNP